MNENQKQIKVINGDGNDLNISPVYDHIKSDDNVIDNNNKKKEIVIPKKSPQKSSKKKR